MFLTVNNISKTYGAAQILKAISFTLAADQRIGLVGANGAGKSTLIKIIVGEIEPDGGFISLHPGAKIGYLAQVLTHIDGKTMDELIRESMAELRHIEARMRELETTMASNPPDMDAILSEYGDLSEQFERKGGYDLDHRMDMVLEGLSIAHLPRDRTVDTLSGGERTRIGLAVLLLSNPDILLLDEPTNHLDFAAMEWLESYLRTYHGAALIVSHDRQFLNRTVQAILEIDENSHELKRYTGDYDAYAAAKVLERVQWETRFQTQLEEIRELRKALKSKAVQQIAPNRPPTDNDKMGYDFKTGRIESVISRNIRNVEERLRRIEEDPVPRPPDPLRMSTDFDPHTMNNPIPLTVSNISKTYGDRVILRGASFSLGANERAVIVAPNGAGKSTLLRVIAGVETPDSGEIIRAASAQIGYLDQEGGNLPDSQTLLEAYRDALGVPLEQAKGELFRYGLFRYEDMIKPISALSLGQRRKLQIALVIAQRANLLLLDEPTNHLSFDVLEAFESALRDFHGAVLAVSHDRRFIEGFNGEVWALRDGMLVQNPDRALS